MVLGMLARQPDSQKPLMEARALSAMADVLRDSSSDSNTLQHAMLVTCVIIEHNLEANEQAMALGIADALVRILRDDHLMEDLLCGFTINALQNLAIHKPNQPALVEAGAIDALGGTLNTLFGKTGTAQKLCLQTMDMLIRSLDDQTARLILPSLLQNHPIADIIWYNLRADNAEVVCWSILLLSMLACHQTGREQLQRIPRLARLLAPWISPGEYLLSHDVLRILCALSHDNEQMQEEIIRAGIVERLVSCMSAAEEHRDLSFSALIVLHILQRKGMYAYYCGNAIYPNL